MKCYIHPEVDAIGACTSCHNTICDKCSVEVQGRLICRECLATKRGTSHTVQQVSEKDPQMAVLLEILPAFVGFLGIGWIYAGNVPTGLMIMFCNWIAIAGTVVAAIFSLGLCLIPLFPVLIAGAGFSAYNVHKFVVNTNQ